MRLLCCFFLILGASSAQGVISFSGQVVNSLTGQPIPRALVELQPMGYPRNSVPKVAMSDDVGNFRFEGLTPGMLRVSASRPQYQAASALNDRTQLLELRESVTGHVLRLTPLSAITGLVMDSLGNPILGANVEALKIEIHDGRRSVGRSRTVRADDQGRYRMWNLPAGKYYLLATGKNGGLRNFVGAQSPVMIDDHEAFVPAYHGGTFDLSTATPLEIQPGQTGEADFLLNMQRSTKISGRVVNLEPAGPVTFRLLRGAEDVQENPAHRIAFNPASGIFSVFDVVPGDYRLRVSQGSGENVRTGELSVSVDSNELKGVTLALGRGLSLPVQLESDYSAQPIPSENRYQAPPTIQLYRAGKLVRTQRAEDKQISIPNLEPGTYEVEVQSNDGFVSGLSYGSTDLLPHRLIQIVPGVDPPPLLLRYQKQGFGIAVELSPVIASKVKGLLLTPTFPAAFASLFRSPNFGAKVIRFGGLPPGEYRLYALTQVDELPYNDPAWLQSLKGGQSVSLSGKPGEVAVTVKELLP